MEGDWRTICTCVVLVGFWGGRGVDPCPILVSCSVRARVEQAPALRVAAHCVLGLGTNSSAFPARPPCACEFVWGIRVGRGLCHHLQWGVVAGRVTKTPLQFMRSSSDGGLLTEDRERHPW